MNIDWFPRLADIPGVGYSGPSGIDRRRLNGHNFVPEVKRYGAEYGPTLAGTQSLSWSTGSASPVHEHALDDMRATPTGEVLRNIAEALELPGEPTDYHFAIQRAATALWDRRRSEPDVLDDVERLCWLDIRLVQARPDAISDEYTDERRFYIVTAFKTLITLYEREGALHEALEVARVAERFDQLGEKAEELRQRMAVLEAENA